MLNTSSKNKQYRRTCTIVFCLCLKFGYTDSFGNVLTRLVHSRRVAGYSSGPQTEGTWMSREEFQPKKDLVTGM